MSSEIKQRGGAREGAGRHFKGSSPRVTTSLMLDAELKAKAQEYARKSGMTFSDFINYLLREELGE